MASLGRVGSKALPSLRAAQVQIAGKFPTANNVLVTLASWQSQPTTGSLAVLLSALESTPLSLPPTGCSSWCAAHNRELSHHSSPTENKPSALKHLLLREHIGPP